MLWSIPFILFYVQFLKFLAHGNSSCCFLCLLTWPLHLWWLLYFLVQGSLCVQSSLNIHQEFSWWGPHFSLFATSNTAHVEMDEPATWRRHPPAYSSASCWKKSLKSSSSEISLASYAPRSSFCGSSRSCFQYPSAQACIESRDRHSVLCASSEAEPAWVSTFCMSKCHERPQGDTEAQDPVPALSGWARRQGSSRGSSSWMGAMVARQPIQNSYSCREVKSCF